MLFELSIAQSREGASRPHFRTAAQQQVWKPVLSSARVSRASHSRDDSLTSSWPSVQSVLDSVTPSPPAHHQTFSSHQLHLNTFAQVQWIPVCVLCKCIIYVLRQRFDRRLTRHQQHGLAAPSRAPLRYPHHSKASAGSSTTLFLYASNGHNAKKFVELFLPTMKTLAADRA